jgi:hypothetical protein
MPDQEVTVQTISIAPTPEGYANIARRFAGQIIDDLPRRRIADDRAILDSFIEIVAWLAATDRRDLIERIRDDVYPTRRSHKPEARARLADAIIEDIDTVPQEV